jgi:hypothetical protein
MIIKQIAPNPVHEDYNSVSYSDQEINVDQQPENPCDKTSHMKFFKIEYSFISTDGGHLTFISITEMILLLAKIFCIEVPDQKSGLLHSNRS